jgi:hypothetical protein
VPRKVRNQSRCLENIFSGIIPNENVAFMSIATTVQQHQLRVWWKLELKEVIEHYLGSHQPPCTVSRWKPNTIIDSTRAI